MAIQIFEIAAVADIEIPPIEKVSSIDDIVQPFINNEATHSLSIGVYNKGNIQYYNYGTCSEKNPAVPTEKSIYEIGSITKTFTATVLAQMVKEGEVILSDPISKYLPKGVFTYTSDSLSITLEELATHTSGLPRLASNGIMKSIINLKNPYKSYSLGDLHDFLSEYEPTSKTNRKPEYSNLGFGLLGSILSKVDNLTYEKMVEQRIFNPLSMSNSFVDRKGKNMQTGHNGKGKPTSAWDFQSMAGAGAIRSCTHDMMQYLITNLNSEKENPFNVTHIPRKTFRAQDKIGLAWILKPTKYPEETRIFHNGGTGGFRSSMMMIKERETGVIILSNSTQDVDSMCLRIMEFLEKTE